MKHLSLTILACVAMLCSQAQTNDVAGKMVLHPYLSADTELPASVRDLLADKLAQIVTQNDLACSGSDERFIITAHLQPVKQETTATIPAKTIVRQGLTLYIGDGLDDTLFSSLYVELKGIGADSEQATLAALRKLRPSDERIDSFVAQGKQRIADYYEQKAPYIITAAKAAAEGKRYAEAMSMLQTIPSVCSQYDEAQRLIGQYGLADYEETNNPVIIVYHFHWW